MKAGPLNTDFGVVLLDIEGTTTPISFVYDVLFPYAQRHAKRYLEDHISSPDVQSDVEGLRRQHAIDLSEGHGPPALAGDSPGDFIESLAAYIHWLMDGDRKLTPLKSLQGRIWQEGYERGELLGQVFDDVPRAFSLWNDRGKRVCIYSSGSVLAQRLLFSNTSAGDLTGFISDYFDTNVGGKRDRESYRRIAASLGRAASEIVFVSDVTAELDAARSAGLLTVLCVRPGNPSQPRSAAHPVVGTFDEFFSAD